MLKKKINTAKELLVTSDLTLFEIAAECGYDYIECGFQMFAGATEEQLCEWEEREKKYGIYCESTNCFLPNSHKVTGENVDYDKDIEIDIKIPSIGAVWFSAERSKEKII